MPKTNLSRKQAIRQYCLECCCESSYEVLKCPTKDCPLYPFRKGREEHQDSDSSGKD